jgi:tetratricopeptide (TPR) repeat protein
MKNDERDGGACHVVGGRGDVFGKIMWKKGYFRHMVLSSFFILHSSFFILFAQQTDSLTARYADGVRLAAEGRREEALRRFEEVLAEKPDHDPSLYEAAAALAAGRELGKAVQYAARALALDPENRWYKERNARLLLMADRYDEALPLYRELTASGGRFNPENYRLLAMLYYEKGQTDDALATLDSIETRMGRTPELIDLKRGILLEADRVDDAVGETEKYVAEAPYDEENRLVLAELYTYRGRDSLARATLEEVLAINPENAEARRLLAPVEPEKESAEKFIVKGDFEGALVVLKRELPTVADDPADFASMGTYLDIASIESYLGRSDSVLLYSRRALEVYPHVVAFYTMIAGAQQYRKEFDEAFKTLAKALKVTPSKIQQSDVVGMVGSLHHELGDDRKAFAEYEKALRLNPDNVLVLTNYAYFMAIGGGSLDRALTMSKRAIELEPGNATYLDTYAWVLYLRGDYTEAKRVMGQALPLDRENNPELLLHYGDILWALDEKFMATQYWKRARDAGYEPLSEIEERLSRAAATPSPAVGGGAGEN